MGGMNSHFTVLSTRYIPSYCPLQYIYFFQFVRSICNWFAFAAYSRHTSPMNIEQLYVFVSGWRCQLSVCHQWLIVCQTDDTLFFSFIFELRKWVGIWDVYKILFVCFFGVRVDQQINRKIFRMVLQQKKEDWVHCFFFLQNVTGPRPCPFALQQDDIHTHTVLPSRIYLFR